MRAGGDEYDSTHSIRLSGEEGLLGGEAVTIRLGESVLVGRSRECDLSTRRSRTFLDASEEEQRLILKNRTFLRVSRRHARISFLGLGHVEVWDLSRNGTYVDGKKVDRIFLDVNGGDGHEVRLADSERLRLSR
jgi:pSer/pThr/pTyr-binding forkhead associated (FHA) protein